MFSLSSWQRVSRWAGSSRIIIPFLSSPRWEATTEIHIGDWLLRSWTFFQKLFFTHLFVWDPPFGWPHKYSLPLQIPDAHDTFLAMPGFILRLHGLAKITKTTSQIWLSWNYSVSWTECLLASSLIVSSAIWSGPGSSTVQIGWNVHQCRWQLPKHLR